MNEVSLIIGADICPTNDNLHFFENGNIKLLLGEDIYNILIDADFRIFNLECPLTDKNTPINKWGPVLRANTSTVNGIKSLNPSLLTLANNHIYDHGKQGIESTINILNKYNIPFSGIKSNEYILEKNKIKIGIYVCAEHEFNLESSFFDSLETPDKIYQLKKKCDYVIVLYHGGKEYYQYPSPLLQKRFRKMAEKGALLVVAQHTHCIGCYEKYNDSILVYGQGNFIYNENCNNSSNSSLLLKINLSKESFFIDYIPVSKFEDKKHILNDFEKRSLQILKSGFIENEYLNFAKKMHGYYLDSFQGNTYIHRIFRKIFKKNISKFVLSKSNLLRIQNYVQCEAHRELFLAGFIK